MKEYNSKPVIKEIKNIGEKEKNEYNKYDNNNNNMAHGLQNLLNHQHMNFDTFVTLHPFLFHFFLCFISFRPFDEQITSLPYDYFLKKTISIYQLLPLFQTNCLLLSSSIT